jgi:hypothetical protein
MLALGIIVVIGSTIWVGFDAQGRDWSDNNMARGPYAWVAGCLILWILFFPAYLVQRDRVPLK